MKFHYSRRNLQRREIFLERFFEIIPGASSWTVLIGITFLSFIQPIWAAVFIIAFDLYWLMRLFYMMIFLIAAYRKMSYERQTDWIAKIREMESKKREVPHPKLEEVVHLVLFPVAKESRQVLEPGVKSLVDQEFSCRQLLVVFAVEERAPAPILEAVKELKERYGRHFYDFLVVVHPDGLPGEARVKGANAAYAAKETAIYLQDRKIPFENVVLSCLESDTVVSPQYFSCLTYHFLACPDRNRASFQPIPVYHNNIWEAPAFARVIDIGSSFFQMVEATNPEKLCTFSSHGMSFKALVDVGYWPVDIISDDSAIFWKAFIHFDGDYRVVPMYVTVSMDVVHAGTWWETAVNAYRQKRRWAWGVENFPLVARAFLRGKKIFWLKRIRMGFRLLEGHVSWATWGFLLTILGWLPAFAAGREFSNTVVYYTAPRILRTIFNLSTFALGTTIVLSLLLLPKKRVRHPIRRKVLHALEWLLVPVIAIFFSTLPALDAQTRLMRAKYMEFWVTEKKRG